MSCEGRPVWQRQQPAEPVEAITAEGGDLLPVLGTGDDSTQGDDENVLQVMQAAPATPGIARRPKNLQMERSGTVVLGDWGRGAMTILREPVYVTVES